MNFKPDLIKVFGCILIAFFITLVLSLYLPVEEAEVSEQKGLFSMIVAPEPIVLVYLLLIFVGLYVLWSLVEKEKSLKKARMKMMEK